jgi:hypothetical protein
VRSFKLNVANEMRIGLQGQTRHRDRHHERAADHSTARPRRRARGDLRRAYGSTKPLIYDGDTGGHPEIFEDKAGVEQNSLFGMPHTNKRKQELESVPAFCEKIRAGQAATVTKEFMITRAPQGAQGEEAPGMGRGGAQARRGVHRRRRRRDHDPLQGQVPREMFLSVFKFEKKVPVVTVPATYNSITELVAEGSSIIIYASHLLRAAYPTMLGVAESILTNARSVEADATLMPVLHTCCAKLMPGQPGGVDRGREERR